ncbi:hypothetical protein CA267_002035 [Alteromonas pelagimontana]|uniref:Uncharacterized protein n=1 Tax=Alteromonas pelagimontana TaxID=1858656 RepID=A0A6M4M927_9ALTE|nr:hypothetical protein [Alteromonas pelagimontana]QJR79663.1 hypothetical protein CA267_002035 [Alteromonas pelagimontana]
MTSKTVLRAMESELKKLVKKAETAKRKCDETMSAASEIIEVRKKAHEILSGDLSADEKLKLIEPLAKREKRAFTNSKRNLVKLMDAQHEAEIERDELMREISSYKYRMNLSAA